MRKIIAIAVKELGAYFKSPLAYIILVVTISVFNVFFFVIIDENREASLRDMFKLMEFMFVFIVPLLTMRVFAEEKNSGTIEFLMTCPVNNTQIVVGKYLGGLTFFTILLAITCVYYAIIASFGRPDRMGELIGYLGIWLEGALFVAIGIFVSSLTKSQIVAAIGSYTTILLLYFSISFIKYFGGLAKEIIQYASFWSHAQNFSSGLVTLADITYFLSSIVFCIILTRIGIENRLWR